MKILTKILQDMLVKAIHGVSNNKMIPISNLIGIQVKDGILTLMTHDGVNQLRISDKVDSTEDFYTIVNAELFSKLISKTNKEYTELINNSNFLEINSNGNYKLEIAVNEEGDMIKFPDIPIYSENIELNLQDLQMAINVARPSVAKTMEIPFLTGYYFADSIITTDRQMVCKVDKPLLTFPALISYDMGELLLLIDGVEKINLSYQDGWLCFSSPKYCIYGKQLEGKEDYPVKEIENLLHTEYESSITVNKNVLLNVLDRMSIFVNGYDKTGVYIRFKDKHLELESQKSNAVEILTLDSTNNFMEKQYLIDIQMLKDQVQTLLTDEVNIEYGSAKSIKLVEGKVSLVIALLDE